VVKNKPLLHNKAAVLYYLYFVISILLAAEVIHLPK